MAFTFVVMVSARPQDYSQQQQNKARADETTTWIPIIQYDKEQSIDGSYKTR